MPLSRYVTDFIVATLIHNVRREGPAGVPPRPSQKPPLRSSGTVPKSIQGVRPLLHHPPVPLRLVGRSVVDAAVRVTNCVRQLVLDVVGSEPLMLVEDRSSHGQEAMPRHLVLTEPRPLQDRQHGVVANRALTGARVAPPCQLAAKPLSRWPRTGSRRALQRRH